MKDWQKAAISPLLLCEDEKHLLRSILVLVVIIGVIGLALWVFT